MTPKTHLRNSLKEGESENFLIDFHGVWTQYHISKNTMRDLVGSWVVQRLGSRPVALEVLSSNPGWGNQKFSKLLLRTLKLAALLQYKIDTIRVRVMLGLGQTFFILWFTDHFAPYPMSGFGIKIKIKFQ